MVISLAFRRHIYQTKAFNVSEIHSFIFHLHRNIVFHSIIEYLNIWNTPNQHIEQTDSDYQSGSTKKNYTNPPQNLAPGRCMPSLNTRNRETIIITTHNSNLYRIFHEL